MSKHESDLIAKKVKNLILDDKMKVCTEHYRGHPWSIVKLLLLGQWAYVYTVILKNWRGGIRYVDLLAGSGTTLIKESGIPVKGSAFAVKEFAYRPFDDYVLVERDAERYNALLANSKWLGNITPPIRGDCNKHIESIFSVGGYHNLVFIDNEGFDVTWESMEHILSSQSDIIINFPTKEFRRTTNYRTAQCLDRFYGDRSWQSAKFDMEYALRIYMEKLARRFYELRKQEVYVEPIRVGNVPSYFYDIILVCRNGDYVRVWEQMKRKWDSRNPQSMKSVLEYLSGKISRLDVFDEFGTEVSSIQNKQSKKTEQNDKEGKDLKLTDFS